MCFPKRFYPLRRRHQISPPRSGPVTRVFEINEDDFSLYNFSDSLRHLATFLNGGKKMDHSNPFKVLEWCHQMLKTHHAGQYRISTIEKRPFERIIRVTITTPPQVSPKLASYFHNRG